MIILNEAGQGMWEEKGQVSCKAAGHFRVGLCFDSGQRHPVRPSLFLI